MLMRDTYSDGHPIDQGGRRGEVTVRELRPIRAEQRRRSNIYLEWAPSYAGISAMARIVGPTTPVKK